jgi:hypothetical protein
MADNVAITAGTGTNIKTDQLAGGEHVQYVKLIDGTADSSTVISGDSNGLKVQLGAAIPAGTNAIGKLSANSGVIIGDVNVVSNSALIAGTAVIGKVGIDQTTPGTTNKVVSSTNTGRTYVALYASLITGVTTEALATFTKNVNGTATTSQTAYTITNGKTFRITALQVIINNTTTTANNIIVNVRVAASVSASSPIVATCAAASAAAVATVKGMANLAIPDGIDIAGDGSIQIGVSHLENVTTASIASFTLIGFEY